MPVANPPAATTPEDLKNWAQSVADSATAAEAAIDAIESGYTATGEIAAPSVRVTGKTGATSQQTTLAGGTNTGAAPTTGAHVVGELVIGHDGKLWVCTTAGTPGTWKLAGGSGGAFTLLVAASNSTTADKDAADFVCDGTNDEVVLQDVIDTYGTGDVLRVHLAPGSYSIDAQVDVDCAADVYLVGLEHSELFEQGAVYLGKETVGDFSMFACSGNGKVRSFVGLYIDEFTTETITSPVIEVATGVRLRMDHCGVNAFTGSAGQAAIGFVAAGKLTLDHCDIESDGIAVDIPANDSVLSVVIRKSYLYAGGAHAVNVVTTIANSDVLLDEAWIDGGVRIDGDTGFTPLPELRAYDCIISGQNTNSPALYLTDVDRVEIIGGRYRSSSISATAALRLSNIERGLITGIEVEFASGHGMWLADCDDLVVEGNNLEGYGRGTDATYSGILLDGDTNRCSIISNRLRHGYGSGNRPLYGVRVDDSTCDDNLVEGNDLLGSAKTNGDEFSDAGTGTRGWLVRELHYIAGAAAVQQYPHRVRFDRPAVLGVTYLNAATAPVTTSLIGDVRKNGTAIYTTTGNRPAIAAAGNANTPTAVPDTKYVAAGDYLNAEITQVGSGGAGSDVTIAQRYMPI